ncbi:hypothetical protein Aglo01_05120 [Actinokineospora globicatena]|nr:hypothetical protein Aglo01_05120 [Actinokineospora globicatena]
MMCALVPLIPNDDTAARRGRSTSGHGRASVSSDTAPRPQAACGVGASTCSVLGRVACRSAITILITPAAPDAAWVWPMFDFRDPKHNGSARPFP